MNSLEKRITIRDEWRTDSVEQLRHPALDQVDEMLNAIGKDPHKASGAISNAIALPAKNLRYQCGLFCDILGLYLSSLRSW
jgi:hypothetical protein